MDAPEFPQDKLIDLYKIAIEEYRFEVRLGWDRTTYFLVLNSAVLTVATGLLKLDVAPAVYLFIALLFLFGCGTAMIGSRTITKNHEYYRRTMVKKALIEDRLGLTKPAIGVDGSLNFSIGTTPSQSDHKSILEDPEGYVNGPHKRTAITYWLRWILRAVAVVDGCGAATAMAMMIYSPALRHGGKLLVAQLFQIEPLP